MRSFQEDDDPLDIVIPIRTPINKTNPSLSTGNEAKNALYSSYCNDLTRLERSFQVSIDDMDVIVNPVSLFIYTVLFWIFTFGLLRSINLTYSAWLTHRSRRRVMTTLATVQALLGAFVMAWIIYGHFNLDPNRLLDSIILIVGQRFSENIISIMLLLKAYHIRRRNPYVLMIGICIITANFALVIWECVKVEIPSFSCMQGVADVARILRTSITMMLNMALNIYVTGCFLYVIIQHARIAPSAFYSLLIRDGMQFVIICALTNIIVGTLFLSRGADAAIPSIISHVGWAIQSRLIIQQLIATRKSYETTVLGKSVNTLGHGPNNGASMPPSPMSAMPEKRPTAAQKSKHLPSWSEASTALRDENDHSDLHFVGEQVKSDKPHKQVTVMPNPGILLAETHGTAIPQHHFKTPIKSAMRASNLHGLRQATPAGPMVEISRASNATTTNLSLDATSPSFSARKLSYLDLYRLQEQGDHTLPPSLHLSRYFRRYSEIYTDEDFNLHVLNQSNTEQDLSQSDAQQREARASLILPLTRQRSRHYSSFRRQALDATNLPPRTVTPPPVVDQEDSPQDVSIIPSEPISGAAWRMSYMSNVSDQESVVPRAEAYYAIDPGTLDRPNPADLLTMDSDRYQSFYGLTESHHRNASNSQLDQTRRSRSSGWASSMVRLMLSKDADTPSSSQNR